MKVSGWIRNLQDGRVEALVAGDEEQIDAFVEACREGPRLAEVTRVDVRPDEPMPRMLKGFTKRFTA